VIDTVPARVAAFGGRPSLCPDGAGWSGVAVKSQLAEPVAGGALAAALVVALVGAAGGGALDAPPDAVGLLEDPQPATSPSRAVTAAHIIPARR
jgi:hypothetical protein